MLFCYVMQCNVMQFAYLLSFHVNAIQYNQFKDINSLPTFHLSGCILCITHRLVIPSRKSQMSNAENYFQSIKLKPEQTTQIELAGFSSEQRVQIQLVTRMYAFVIFGGFSISCYIRISEKKRTVNLCHYFCLHSSHQDMRFIYSISIGKAKILIGKDFDGLRLRSAITLATTNEI